MAPQDLRTMVIDMVYPVRKECIIISRLYICACIPDCEVSLVSSLQLTGVTNVGYLQYSTDYKHVVVINREISQCFQTSRGPDIKRSRVTA